MDRIVILDENTANQIAAGEVIERPASVVKELVENSIDAGTSTIKIEITKGGISLIRVTDDGRGISNEDVEMAFERHGTSKIRNASDLESINTMGFRGEALPSIASVSNVELNTATKTGGSGVRIRISGGKIEGKQKSSRTAGTTVTVRNLFFNMPARYKFLKNDTTEARYCTDIVSRLALAHTDIRFRYFSNGTEILSTPGDGNLKNAVYCVYGREISENLFEVEYDDGTYFISGFAGNRSAARGNRQNQTTFVNGRFVKSREITAAVEKAYETEIMKGKFPFYVLNIDFNPKLVDVNVHPAKSEVRFAKSSDVFSVVHTAIRAALDKNRVVATGSDRQARIRRNMEYVNSDESSINASFLSDADRKIKIDPDISKKLHESLIAAKDSLYQSGNEMVGTPVATSGQTDDPTPGIDILDRGRFTGILFKTFIMLELDESEIILVDQHAAHERITYESLLHRFRNSDRNSQVLLAPVIVSLDQAEASTADENASLLNDLGFEFDFIGPKDVAVRTIPSEIIERDTAGVFREAVDAITSNKGREHMLIEKEVIYSMACKSSVKANTELNSIEVNALLNKLKSLDNPYTCPHGRPVLVKLTRRELEKLFKRIV